MTDTPFPPGRGLELLGELAAADAVIAPDGVLWTEWDTKICVWGGSSQAIRDDFYARQSRAQADRQAIANRVWEYFERDATAEERAAWELMDPRWQHPRERR